MRVCISLSISSHAILISDLLSSYWYVVKHLSSISEPYINLSVASGLSKPRMDMNIDIVTRQTGFM